MGIEHPVRPAAHRRVRATLALVIATMALIGLWQAAASASAAPYAFEPINYKRVPLPASMSKDQIAAPVFTPDGKHLVFQDGGHVWVADLHGKKVRCITCEGAGPSFDGFIDPFPDGKRLFLFSSPEGVIECKPSVINCKSHTFLPVDTSAAIPPGGVIAPGGAANSYQIDVGGAAAAKLAPDGEHIAFSDVRSDAFEEMVIAKLERQPEKYVITDARVLNPEGPSSVLDPSVGPWSDTGALYEFKTFTHGGADATYVQVGGEANENPDVWEINLATGERKRLTSNADWDEDMALSPDGSQLAMWSNRTRNYFDMQGGLMPVRDFIGMPMVGALANYYVNSGKKRSCEGPTWLLPATGDEGARLAGQPIVDYSQPKLKAIDSTVPGWPVWSPDSTKLALSMGDEETESDSAPVLEYAEFTARKPTAPEPVVKSDVGAWAPTPENWHGAFGFNGEKTLSGAGGGTVKLTYNGNPGAIYGTWSETYENYSEDGKSFVTGTTTIEEIEPNLGKVHESSHLKMTGENTGYTNIDLTLTESKEPNGPASVEGSAETNYDGTTVKGPPQEVTESTPCPNMNVPRPQIKATANNLGGDEWEVKVTVSIAKVGANEAQTDTEPVNHAMIKGAGKATYTDNEGVAHVTAPHGKHKRTVLTVIAGEDLTPTALFLE